MSLQTNTSNRASRRAKSDLETPVQKIALPKKKATAANATAATTKANAASTKAPIKAAAGTTKAAGVNAKATTKNAAGTTAKAQKAAAPKRFKRGIEGIYLMRNGTKVACKTVTYSEHRNGLWLSVKQADGTITLVRPSMFTPNAA